VEETKRVFKRFTLFAFVFILLGFALIIASLIESGMMVSTEGIVIDVKEKIKTDDDGDESVLYYPVVEYETEDGELRIFESSFGSYPPRYETGDRVKVFYDPENEDRVNVEAGYLLFLVHFSLPWDYSLFQGSKKENRLVSTTVLALAEMKSSTCLRVKNHALIAAVT